MPDIDLDFPDRSRILDIIQHIPAKLVDERRHNSGVYVQNIPLNPLTGNASIDYKRADDRGYFKIDFLNVSIYQNIRDEDHLIKLIEQEPIWELLDQDEFTDLLFHLHGHGEIVKTLKPRNIEQLAAVLAIIRPAKRHLLHESWDRIFEEVWQPPLNNDYYFKKSHSFGYAQAVIVQMNLICEQLKSANHEVP